MKNEIEKNLKELNYLIESKKGKIIIDMPSNMTINTIPNGFDRIIQNLVTNAIRYKFPNRNPIIEISTVKKGTKVIISVKDNGLGIDLQKNKSKIFGMYNTFHDNKDAVGLGLFIAKNHVVALGGTIDVKSRVGEGSEFNITLYE